MDNQNGLENGKMPSLNVENEQNYTQEEAFKEEFIKDLSSFVEGQIVEGTVVAVTTDSVFIDIGYKSEGDILIEEFIEKPEVGDSLNVVIVKKESRDGRLILSKQKADEINNWNAIKIPIKMVIRLKG